MAHTPQAVVQLLRVPEVMRDGGCWNGLASTKHDGTDGLDLLLGTRVKLINEEAEQLELLLLLKTLNDIPVERFSGCALALALPQWHQLRVVERSGISLLHHPEEVRPAAVGRGVASIQEEP